MKNRILSKIVNKVISLLISCIISACLGGCDMKDEKSNYYYLSHPEELEADYKYCLDHPSKGVCHNIVKKYFWYQNVTNNDDLSGYGDLFADLDAPAYEPDIDGAGW